MDDDEERTGCIKSLSYVFNKEQEELLEQQYRIDRFFRKDFSDSFRKIYEDVDEDQIKYWFYTKARTEARKQEKEEKKEEQMFGLEPIDWNQLLRSIGPITGDQIAALFSSDSAHSLTVGTPDTLFDSVPSDSPASFISDCSLLLKEESEEDPASELLKIDGLQDPVAEAEASVFTSDQIRDLEIKYRENKWLMSQWSRSFSDHHRVPQQIVEQWFDTREKDEKNREKRVHIRYPYRKFPMEARALMDQHFQNGVTLPPTPTLNRLAEQTGLSVKQVQTYFKNKRTALQRREKKERRAKTAELQRLQLAPSQMPQTVSQDAPSAPNPTVNLTELYMKQIAQFAHDFLHNSSTSNI
ncbi:unnamed protein product [Caenorhabditis sp. 36 PRJEB53466]|nr:unnamed protein product [Caenorhabditis sp. 36 PRJEB53466]